MDQIDKKILRLIQSHLPLTDRPYLALSAELGLSEDELLERLGRLKDRGVIRRIGGSFNSRGLGFTSTLCAAKVPPEKLDQFVALVNSYAGVTHNYLREHDYNVWFTFIASSRQDIESSLAEISSQTGVEPILNLPAVNTFKIQVDFPV